MKYNLVAVSGISSGGDVARGLRRAGNVLGRDMKIKIITTGGTIDKVYFDARSEFQVGEPQIGEVLTRSAVAFEFEVQRLLRKDSLDLTDEDRRLIRETISTSPQRHVIVTHGTDTMVRTAKLLLDLTGKVIVFTGSMQPARFQTSDAIFNIGCAVAAVQVLPDGVYIAMNGRIFPAGRVRKNQDKNQFEDA